jgi:hypothetical protein
LRFFLGREHRPIGNQLLDAAAGGRRSHFHPAAAAVGGGIAMSPNAAGTMTFDDDFFADHFWPRNRLGGLKKRHRIVGLCRIDPVSVTSR